MATLCLFLFLLFPVGDAMRHPFKAPTPRRSTRHFSSSSSPPPRNFEDVAVDCSSEGGRWRDGMSQAYTPSPPPSEPSVDDDDDDDDDDGDTWTDTLALAAELWALPATAVSVVQLCDRIDAATPGTRAMGLLRLRRQTVLTAMLQANRATYLDTVNFLGARVPRDDLPNWQDVPYFGGGPAPAAAATATAMGDLIGDCTLPNVTYSESPLDKVLLFIFRDLVRKEIQWRSETPGIRGLLEEGRHYMLSPAGAVTENQHAFVRRTLGALLTPVLPPFYRVFMAGIVPSEARGDPKWLADGAAYVIEQVRTWPVVGNSSWVRDNLMPGTQIGPWFYAPLLTSVVTPPFLNFLVGTSFCLFFIPSFFFARLSV
jgi:hypothetical protein